MTKEDLVHQAIGEAKFMILELENALSMCEDLDDYVGIIEATGEALLGVSYDWDDAEDEEEWD